MLPLLTIVLPSSSEGQLSDGGSSLVHAEEGAESELQDLSPVRPAPAPAPSPGAELQASETASSQPSIEDTSSVGGWVWIVLFGWVMALSLVANLALATAVLTDRRKRVAAVHLILLILFAINLVDYFLLSFEFSLGVAHTFPHGQVACMAWQGALRATPIVQAAAVSVLLHVTARNFIFPTSPSGESSPSAEAEQEQGRLLAVSTRRGNGRVVALAVVLLLAIALVAAVPTAAVARLLRAPAEAGADDGEQERFFCEVDLSPVVGEDQKEAINVYYIVYSSIFSYWLPLMISLRPLLQLVSPRADSTKYPEVTLVVATAVSFFLFYALHACVVATRHALDLAGTPISTYHQWMLKVIQSLFWLLAYFWHFARPALVILLDPELKEAVLYSPSKMWKRPRSRRASAESEGAHDQNSEEGPRPIVKRGGNSELLSLNLEPECSVALIQT